MKKKKYEKPSMLVVLINQQPKLLGGSPTRRISGRAGFDTSSYISEDDISD